MSCTIHKCRPHTACGCSIHGLTLWQVIFKYTKNTAIEFLSSHNLSLVPVLVRRLQERWHCNWSLIDVRSLKSSSKERLVSCTCTLYKTCKMEDTQVCSYTSIHLYSALPVLYQTAYSHTHLLHIQTRSTTCCYNYPAAIKTEGCTPNLLFVILQPSLYNRHVSINKLSKANHAKFPWSNNHIYAFA